MDTENVSTTTRQNQSSPSYIDLTFHDLSYVAGKGKNAKTILHQMNGSFKSGHLSAILGPSGAGKTSLMNILAGLKSSGVKGRVDVNGVDRDLKRFRKKSAYITQKDHLLSHLSVDEYMTIAVHLKLGTGVSQGEKISTIENVMKTLGLMDSRKTQISCLSGGECKRLSIGLELIDNPAILFLDEPTSGLDSSSSLDCIALLRNIALSGRTVIATIHQPSSRLLHHFDHLYIVAGGSCMYQGTVASLVPYLQTMNLSCPSYYNPADFAMDVACGEYGDLLPQLVSGIENGRLIYRTDSTTSPAQSLSEIRYDDIELYSVEDNANIIDEGCSKKRKKKKKEMMEERDFHRAPFHTQLLVLLNRSFKTIWRDKVVIYGRFIAHIFVGILMGMLYWQLGDDAAVALSNTGLLFFNIFFVFFVSLWPTALTFPIERKVIRREHLNHWYSLTTYYLAKMMVDIPIQIFFTTLYLVIVYTMSNQSMFLEHFFMLLFTTIGVALVGQGVGLLFSAAFGIQAATFLATTASIPFLFFCSFLVNLHGLLPDYLNWILHLSFMYHGFDGSMLSVYSHDRPPLSCSEDYCYFRYPLTLLKQFQLHQSSYYRPFIGQFFLFCGLRIAAYFMLRFKLRHVR